MGPPFHGALRNAAVHRKNQLSHLCIPADGGISPYAECETLRVESAGFCAAHRNTLEPASQRELSVFQAERDVYAALWAARDVDDREIPRSAEKRSMHSGCAAFGFDSFSCGLRVQRIRIHSADVPAAGEKTVSGGGRQLLFIFAVDRGTGIHTD